MEKFEKTYHTMLNEGFFSKEKTPKIKYAKVLPDIKKLSDKFGFSSPGEFLNWAYEEENLR